MINKMRYEFSFSNVLFFLLLIMAGGFNEHVSCLISCIISVYIFVKVLKNRELKIKTNLLSLSIMIICLFYGIVCFWALDSGMAFIGFVKFLPVFLYMFLLWQEQRGSEIFEFLPYFAVCMVVVSALGAQISFLKGFFEVAGRFAGFFQYPNTFALFLLLCELLLLQRKNLKIVDYVSMCILIGGLLYTGSRTVFVLFVISNLAMLLLVGNRKMRIALFAIMILTMIAVALLMFVFKDSAIINRYLNIGFGASTFVGRILYFVDALPLLIKYPFGMGYMGYYYIQNSIQTGVYNVAYAHNDFLQIFLDIGWIPGILFLVAIVSFFFKKTVSVSKKIIVATFCLHTFFDFNMQFIAMFLLLIILIDEEEDRIKSVKVKKWFKVIPIVVFVINLYMALALLFAHYKQEEIASAIYPYNTRNNLYMMENEDDLEEAANIADHILKQNKVYFAPYSVKAKYAYTIGDFVEVIRNKNEVFLRYPFKYTEYKEYCVMLINGVSAFSQQGDESSVEICNQEILAACDKLESNKERLSTLGSMIEEQPVLEFSDNVAYYIEQLKGATDR